MKTKSILALIGSLLLGLIIGFIISTQITQSRINNMLRLGMEEGFRNRMVEVINPTEDQKAKLDPIIDKYAQQNAQLTSEMRIEMGNQMRSFYKEIAPIINEDQKDRLKRVPYNRNGNPNFDAREYGRIGKMLMPLMHLNWMSEELKLDDKQVEELEKIRDSFILDMRRLRHENIDPTQWPAVRDSIIQTTNLKIEKVLDENQFRDFQEMINRSHQRNKRGHHGGNRAPCEQNME